MISPPNRACTAPALACSLLVALLLGLPLSVTADDSAKAPTVTLNLTPRANTLFGHTSAVKSRNSVKREGDREGKAVIDVMTNVIRIKTGAKGFEGTLPFSVALVKSETQAFSQGLQPIPRESPLKQFLGLSADYNLYHDGVIKVADIQTKGGLVTASAVRTMLAMGQTVIQPFSPPSRALGVGDTFETSNIRSFPVQGEMIASEMLQKYTVESITEGKVKLKTDTVVRPRRQDQAQKVFGRGTGTVTIDRELGIVEHSHDDLTVEGRILGPKGWIVVKSEAETKNVTRVERNQPTP